MADLSRYDLSVYHSEGPYLDCRDCPRWESPIEGANTLAAFVAAAIDHETAAHPTPPPAEETCGG